MPASKKRSEVLAAQLVEALVDEQESSDEVSLDQMTYALIEKLGHELGQDLSRQVQAALVSRQRERAEPPSSCPECGGRLKHAAKFRELKSVDGPVAIEEQACFCRRCRRTFFPSA